MSAEAIIERAGLGGDLIPTFIITYLYELQSADIDDIMTHLDFKIGGAIKWRHHNEQDDLFHVPTLQRLINERSVEKTIDYINEKFKSIDNTTINKAIVLARIYKIIIKIDSEYITHYALVHNT